MITTCSFFLAVEFRHRGIVGAALVGFATFLVLLFQGEVPAYSAGKYLHSSVVLMAMMLYRNWLAFRELPMNEDPEISLSILLRVSAFGTLPIITLG
jgi:hypothetical protein